MKFFLTERTWKDVVNSIETPLKSDINEKNLIIKIVEKIYSVNLHDKNINEVIAILFQNKNALFWNGFEEGQKAGTQAALRALADNRIINKTTADAVAKEISECSHEIIEKAQKDTERHIADKWRNKCKNLTS